MSMQSLPTSAVTSHLLSPLTAVLVIGLPCRRKRGSGRMTRGAAVVTGALSEAWISRADLVSAVLTCPCSRRC